MTDQQEFEELLARFRARNVVQTYLTQAILEAMCRQRIPTITTVRTGPPMPLMDVAR